MEEDDDDDDDDENGNLFFFFFDTICLFNSKFQDTVCVLVNQAASLNLDQQ